MIGATGQADWEDQMGPSLAVLKRVCGGSLGAVAVLLMLPAAAFALPDQTWVADNGSDSNACTQASPCLTFQGAINKTAAGGEVDAETDGDFEGSGIVINNSITLNGDGHDATVGAASGQAIAVNEDSTTDVVNLIGLNINGFGTGVEGVYYPDGGTLRIENCDIYGFEFDSVVNVTDGASKLEVDGTTMQGGATGVYINEDGGQTTIDNSTIEDTSSYGVEVLNSPGQAVITNSSIEQGGAYGIDVQSSAFFGASVFQMEVDNSTIDGGNTTDGVYDGVGQMTLQNDEVDQNAGNGVEASGTATVSSVNTTVSDNTGVGVLSSAAGAENLMSGDFVTGNGTGLQSTNGGHIVSLGADNTVFGNTVNGTPTSNVPTGAVGPAGANGTNGTNGTNGAQGVAGARGATGVAGAAGKQGAAGQVELVTCKTVTKTEKVHGKTKKVKQQSCTGKLVSGTVKFKTSESRREHATLSRAGKVYATGTVAIGRHGVGGLLTADRRLTKGRYMLTLWRGSRAVSREALMVR
jgi:hypothetical protein